MPRDWIEWHRAYDDPSSALGQRLSVVQRSLRESLAKLSLPSGHSPRIIGMCSGDARDVLPVLAERSTTRTARVFLTEQNPVLAERARKRARSYGLDQVVVRECDGGLLEPYLEFGPADVVMLCGVLGNIRDEEVETTMSALPSLVAPTGFVIWTRGRDAESDPSQWIRRRFVQRGFEEVAFLAPHDTTYRVGVSRLRATTVGRPGTDARMFSFVDE